MTDEEMAAYCHITTDEVSKLSAAHKEAIKAMQKFEIEWDQHVNGLGPRPTNALIDTPRSTAHRKYWRGND